MSRTHGALENARQSPLQSPNHRPQTASVHVRTPPSIQRRGANVEPGQAIFSIIIIIIM